MPGPVEHMGGRQASGGWLAPGLVRQARPEIWVAGVSDAMWRALAKPAYGTLSRCRPGNCRSWRRGFVNVAKTAEWCYV